MNQVEENSFESLFVRQAKAFGNMHCYTDTSAFADNLVTAVELLQTGNLCMPATINHGETGNTWVCSPLTTYCHYAAEELQRYLHPILSKPLTVICKGYGYALERAQIDKAVAINNWMLSTNLYPDLQSEALCQMVDYVLQRWPDHAIWFRSLNGEHNADWLDALRSLGFEMVPSRQVYLFDRLDSLPRRHANLSRDMQLLHRTPLQKIGPGDFHANDHARIAHLYANLYLNKYSRLNPQYTEYFMHRWQEAGLLEFHGLKDAGGVLQAVVGLFRQGNVITAPIVGYNTALPQDLGLYRLLMAIVFEQATLTGATVNLSAGASEFKRLRGGKPTIEYSAVLTKHLPIYRRNVISVLRALTTSIGVPVMKRFQL